MARYLVLMSAVLATGCSSQVELEAPTPTATLRPRSAATPTVTPAAAVEAEPQTTPGPTATPFVHLIREGDTLLGIALQYGVELTDLLLANPGVNPRFLTVGAELIIPLSGASGPIPTATPVPLTLSAVNCYAEIGGATACLLTATLEGGTPVEGVIALVTLVDVAGEAIRTEPAYSPVNLLTPDSVLPLVASFGPPVPQFAAASAVLIGALGAGDPSERYPPLQVTLETEQYSEDRRSATLAGRVRLTSPQQPAQSELRIVALAIDARDELVGYRILESLQIDQLETGLAFELPVTSLGPPIARVLVLAEAR